MVVVPVFQPKGYTPGLPFLGSGMERYTVSGGGATVIELEAGDSIEVTLIHETVIDCLLDAGAAKAFANPL